MFEGDALRFACCERAEVVAVSDDVADEQGITADQVCERDFVVGVQFAVFAVSDDEEPFSQMLYDELAVGEVIHLYALSYR